MPYAKSIELGAAIKRASAWGGAVACGASDGLLIRSHTIKKKRADLADDSLGVYFQREADRGDIDVSGDLSCYLRYDGLDLPIALALGQSAGAPAQQGATTAYSQTLTPVSSIEGLFATLAIDSGINIAEYPTAKFMGLTIKGKAGQPVEVLFHLRADDMLTDSAVNTQATFADVTIAERSNRVLMSQLTCRINDADGAALGGSDEVIPSSFELTFKRRMDAVRTLGSAGAIDEPLEAGRPEITLKMEFPRYSGDQHFADWDAQTAKKCELEFTGRLIESPYSRMLRIRMPRLLHTQADLPIEQGILRHPLEFACLEASSAPSGMSGITAPFVVELINTQSADVLA